MTSFFEKLRQSIIIQIKTTDNRYHPIRWNTAVKEMVAGLYVRITETGFTEWSENMLVELYIIPLDKKQAVVINLIQRAWVRPYHEYRQHARLNSAFHFF